MKTGFVHHTVNANNYTAAQVPALLRGIYAYHTQSRGWRDIGYNYLVDRFGRIWEGRWGGVDRAVVGAHTLGYNEVSFAMSAIGNFDIAQPPQAVLDAYARLFAWKLSLYNIPANQTEHPGEGSPPATRSTATATSARRPVRADTCTPRSPGSGPGARRSRSRPRSGGGGTTRRPDATHATGVHLADPDGACRRGAAEHDQVPAQPEPRRLGVPRPRAA